LKKKQNKLIRKILVIGFSFGLALAWLWLGFGLASAIDRNSSIQCAGIHNEPLIPISSVCLKQFIHYDSEDSGIGWFIHPYGTAAGIIKN